MQHMIEVDPELLIERQIEAHFQAGPGIDLGRGMIADDGQNRIDR